MYVSGRHLLFIAVLFGIITLMGCVSGYVGETVPLENRIVLKDDGPHQGTWTRTHATFEYVYTRTSGQLELSGNIYITDLRSRLNVFSFWLYFLDADGKITEDQGLFASSQMTSGVIKRNLNLPTGTSAISFSYTGQQGAYDTQIDFHYSPFE